MVSCWSVGTEEAMKNSVKIFTLRNSEDHKYETKKLTLTSASHHLTKKFNENSFCGGAKISSKRDLESNILSYDNRA
jgi:hypothetical protein